MRKSRAVLAGVMALVVVCSEAYAMHLGGNDKGDLLPWAQSMTHPADKPLNDKYNGKCFFINLGPTGIRAYIDKKAPTQLLVKYVFQDRLSPAAGKVEIGDVIVGANGKMFKTPAVFHRKQGPRGVHGPARDMAYAIEYSQGKDGQLDLIILRGGKRKIVTVELEVVGEFSPTWPWNCERSEKLRKNLCDFMFENGTNGGHTKIQQVLALWASGDKRAMPMVESMARGMMRGRANYKASGMCTWGWGYQGIFLGEYYNMTKDKGVMPAVEALNQAYELGQYPGGTYGHRPRLFLEYRQATTGKKPYATMAAAGGVCMLAQSTFKAAGLPYSTQAYRQTHLGYLRSAGPDPGGAVGYGFAGERQGEKPTDHAILKLEGKSRFKEPEPNPHYPKMGGWGRLLQKGMQNVGKYKVTWPHERDFRWKKGCIDWIKNEASTNSIYWLSDNTVKVQRYVPLKTIKEPTGPFDTRPGRVGHPAAAGMGALAHFIGNKGNRQWNWLGKHMATGCATSGRMLWDGHANAIMHAFFGTLGAFRADEKDLRKFLDETKLWIILSEPHDGQGLVEQPFGAQRNGTCSVARDRRQYTHVALMALSMPQKRLLITGADTLMDASGISPLYDIQADGFTISRCQKEAKYLEESAPFSTVLKLLDKAAAKDDERGKEATIFAARLRKWIAAYNETVLEKSRVQPAKSLMEFDVYLKRVRGLDEADAIEARKKELKGTDNIGTLVTTYKNYDKIVEYERMQGSSRQTASKKAKVIEKLEKYIEKDGLDGALAAEGKLLLKKMRGIRVASSGGRPSMTFDDGANKPRSSGGSSSAGRPSTLSRPKPRAARTADAATIARYDAILISRISAAVDGGTRPRFLLASLNSDVQIVAIGDTGLVTVETLDPPMQFNMNWKSLGLKAKRGLALGVLREGDDEDHALVAFYALATGDKALADEHLGKAGQVGDAVRAIFE